MFPSLDETQAQWAARLPGLDTSPMEVVAALKHAVGLLDQALDPLYEGADLTPAEIRTLVPLRHAPRPVIARRLAERLGLSPAGVSKTLAKLERRGLIARTPNPADRRSVLVAITEEGARTVDDLFPRQLAAEGELLAGLGEDRERVLGALRRLVEVMEGNRGDGR